MTRAFYRITPVLPLVLLAMSTSAYAQEILWKCHEPSRPMRFASSEETRDQQTPPCEEWIEMRGNGIGELLAALADERFRAANFFLAEAAPYATFAYPETEGEAPVRTTELYENPERFGLEVATPEEAPIGSLVIYDGLGGILVETRPSEGDSWTRQVLYPSAAAGFELVLSDLDIAGKQMAKVLVDKQ